MILTNCAACAAPLAHNAPRCVRCHTRYCNATCQHEANELGRVFQEMNEPKSTQEIKELFRAYDRDRNGKLTLDEFCAGMLKYAAEKKDDPSVHRATTVAHDSDEEHEEIPDEFAENKFKSVADQQRAIRGAAARLCLAGTALVLVFSDPITDVLQTGADRMGIPAFYVGFVVAPLITNGSEVLASYTFAQKRGVERRTSSTQYSYRRTKTGASRSSDDERPTPFSTTPRVLTV